MKHLKRLSLALTLQSVLAFAAFAGETHSPPCPPGETHSPPCTSESVDEDSMSPGETSGPPVSNTVDIVDIAETVRWALTLF